MAIDLRSVETLPHFHTETTLPSSNTTEIQLPPEAGKITIGSETAVIYVFQNGATDGGSLPSNFSFIPSGNIMSIKLGRGRTRAQSVFVAAKSGTPTLHIILEEY